MVFLPELRYGERAPNDSLRRSSGSSFNVNRSNLQLAVNSAPTQKVLPLKSHLSLSMVLSDTSLYSEVYACTLKKYSQVFSDIRYFSIY